MKDIIQFLLLIFYFFGIVIAKGFWSTFFAIFFPFWAWYLVAELALKNLGVI